MNRTQYVNMYERLSKTRTRYAECIKMTRLDGVVFRFTSHDKTLYIAEDDGVKYPYVAANSFLLTALENNIGLVVSNMDIDAIIDDDSITENDLAAGKYDQANVELFLAYWSNTQVGILPLRTSWIGELSMAGAKYSAELRGIAQKLAQVFTNLTSLECRWQFCDAKCGLPEEDYRVASAISIVESKEIVYVGVGNSHYNRFQWGNITFLSGANEGLSMEIIRNYNNRLQLFLPLPYTVSVGDQVSIMYGCDKTYSQCQFYDNTRYFGGEPFLAGGDKLISYPKTFSSKSEEAEGEETFGNVAEEIADDLGLGD